MTFVCSCSEQQSTVTKLKNVTAFPKKVKPSCRGGIAKIYDECGSQFEVIENALETARSTGKTVLISYGAEWCIWCHVFDKYVKGHSKRFNYEWQYHDGDDLKWIMLEQANQDAEKDALMLNHYFADNFVLAHIESFYAPDGEQVLVELGYDVDSIVGVPLILVLNESGNIADKMKSTKELTGLEIRSDSGREFRGYNRHLLLKELKRLKKSAVQF